MQTAAENPMIPLFGFPGWAAPLLWVPWLLLVVSVALVVTAALAWRGGGRGRAGGGSISRSWRSPAWCW
jgi:hypothetical protein